MYTKLWMEFKVIALSITYLKYRPLPILNEIPIILMHKELKKYKSLNLGMLTSEIKLALYLTRLLLCVLTKIPVHI